MTARILAMAALLICAACANDAAAPTQAASAARYNQSGLGTDVNTQLATLRKLTAAYHDPATAAKHGWTIPVTGCMANGDAGAMGEHVGNGAYIGDPTPRVEQPELLMYEPGPNGQRRLVGVEYIIPYDLYARDNTPPVLFGREFARVDGSLVWGLHVWVWAENPTGMFEPWNPKVSCRHAAPSSSGSPNPHQH